MLTLPLNYKSCPSLCGRVLELHIKKQEHILPVGCGGRVVKIGVIVLTFLENQLELQQSIVSCHFYILSCLVLSCVTHNSVKHAN